MKKPLFIGTCTALVTPFLNGKVNYPMLQRLIDRQIEAGIEAIVIAGTTGESAALSDAEKLKMIELAKTYAANRCLIIAGTGSNSTQHTIALSADAENAGADALLIVTPYYNKPPQEGLLAHYTAVVEAVRLPVIVYNVPSRTGVDISEQTCRALSELPNIAGIKEANPDIGKIIRTRKICPPDFYIWSGNDNLTVPILSIGGMGAISVLSNIFPELVQSMSKAALDGDFDTACALQLELQPITDLLFQQVNPIPVKEAMRIIGFDCGPCRLPLTGARGDIAKQLCSFLEK